MLAKKCPKCGAVWYTALPKCAFCGIDGVDQPTSTHTGRLPEKPVPAAQPEPEKPPSPVAVAEVTPIPPSAPPPAAREETPVAASPPETVKAAAEERPAPVEVERPSSSLVSAPRPIEEESPPPAAPPRPKLTPLAPGRKRPDPKTLPPAPQVPSQTLPLVFGLLGLAAGALVPVAIFLALPRLATIMAYLAAAVLLPFAPVGWGLGRRYEDRCIDLGFNPSGLGRTGRILGMVVTIMICLEGSVLAALAALRLISSGPK